MSLRTNRDATLDVFQTIRRAVRKRRRLKLDFTTLMEISPAAALVLAAEIDRWRRLLDFRPVVLDVDRWNSKVCRLLHDMGLFDLVEAQNSPVLDPTKAPTESFIPYRTGKGALGDDAVALRESIEGVIGGELPGRRDMFRGVTEAMTNVSKHAYIGPFRDGTPIVRDAWWIGGGFDLINRRLRVLVFDQGVGIPSTLPRRYAREAIKDVISGRGWGDQDASRIAAAMELGKTRTGMPNQGRGLPDLQLFVRSSNDGVLRILSSRGEYLYREGVAAQLTEHSKPLGGTLIQWETVL